MNKLAFKFLEEGIESDVEINVEEFDEQWGRIAEFAIESKQVGYLQNLWSLDACKKFSKCLPSEIVESHACELFRNKSDVDNFWFLHINCDHYHEFYFRDLIITLLNYMKKYMNEIGNFFIVFENRTPTYDTKKSFVTALKKFKDFDVLENNEGLTHHAVKDYTDKKFIMLFYRDPTLKELLNY